MTQPKLTPDTKRPDIMLFSWQEGEHYLLEGEEHLGAMIMDEDFPAPVLCVNFDGLSQVQEVLGRDFDPTGYWKIKPVVVERLRNQEKLMETKV